ncbi:hypothetical protein SAMN04489761_0283 [Tenacibaculum sp. MAR_2009_124]|uniref:hypothetical protein n=1 Tax=Tenacibaculum sp. MAR_2009_124 TaxID=1250059 RepID=UPI000894AF8C|nr:hypothetical protein [Tenacibaculum sp. MAR_2009_124]SEB37798.1 hypothetical protein SAMN04489761_0283 [Tenacibaculum sp. MAR_2009_124]
MKKTLKKIVITSLLVVLTFYLTDLYIFRGYFTPDILYLLSDKNIETGKEIKNKNCSLSIEKQDNSFLINFKNRSLKPYLVWTYRYKKLFPVNDSIFFLHLRNKVSFPYYKNKHEYGLDCGTGAGVFSINPFESFQIRKSYKEFVNSIYWSNVHQYNSSYDTVKDLIYNKPLLLIDRKQKFRNFKRNDLITTDSTEVSLYIPLFSFDHKELFYVKSNSIRISYLDIIENLTIHEKKIHEDFREF